MGSDSSEGDGLNGVSMIAIHETACEIIERILREHDLLDRPEVAVDEVMKYQHDFNNGVHHAIPALPRDVWVLLHRAFAQQERPTWVNIGYYIERRTRLGEGEFDYSRDLPELGV